MRTVDGGRSRLDPCDMSESTPDRRAEVMCGLFNELQIARFNYLYNQELADRYAKLSKWSRIVSALAASAILAGMLSQDSIGAWLWKGLTALAAVTAALSPILGWDRKAYAFEKAGFAYKLIHDRVKTLLQDMKLSQLTTDHEARKAEIVAIQNSLSLLENESPRKDLIESSWARATQEYPSEDAWAAI